LGVVVEFVAGVSTRLCIGCGGEYPHDDDCEFNWILRWVRWDRGFAKGNSGELSGYNPSPNCYCRVLTLGRMCICGCGGCIFIYWHPGHV
jgi:hypothetical protein